MARLSSSYVHGPYGFSVKRIRVFVTWMSISALLARPYDEWWMRSHRRKETDMKYLLLLTGDGDVPAWDGLSESDQAALFERFEQFQSECAARGVEILAEAALETGASATTVRRSGGARVVSEGPYAAAYEGLGGFYLVETRTSTCSWSCQTSCRRSIWNCGRSIRWGKDGARRT